MPSEIRYQKELGSDLLSYCKDSAKEVLSKIFKTHFIATYNSVKAPFGSIEPGYVLSHIERGLVILDVDEKEIAPTGTSLTIESTFDDIDLEISKLKSPRTQKEIEEGFKKSIEYNLNNFKINRPSPSNYLDTRLQRIEEYYEKKLNALLEVTKVTLEIENPTPDTLKKILQESRQKRLAPLN